MTRKDQAKYLETLKKYENKLSPKEREKFKMLVKRHKDEEELDQLSLKFLAELFEKHHLNRDKSQSLTKLNELFKN